MSNQPLSSGDQSKILIFSLLLSPAVIFLVGAIPALFLGFGIFMMKKSEDFSHIETAVRNFKGYMTLVLIGCVIVMIYLGSTYGDPEYTYTYTYTFMDRSEWMNQDEFICFTIFSSISIAYLILVKILFLNPLKSHSEWVKVNGIFTSKPKVINQQSSKSDVDIIKGEKLKQYSVADELIKWAKLKEDGHISVDEFNEVREKLLKRN